MQLRNVLVRSFLLIILLVLTFPVLGKESQKAQWELEFDGREWIRVGSFETKLSWDTVYVPEEVPANHLTERVELSVNKEAQFYLTLKKAAKLLRQAVEKKCPSASYEVLEETREHLVYEWSHDGCHGEPPTHVIGRKQLGWEGIYSLRYRREFGKITASEREAWLERIRSANLVSGEGEGRLEAGLVGQMLRGPRWIRLGDGTDIQYPFLGDAPLPAENSWARVELAGIQAHRVKIERQKAIVAVWIFRIVVKHDALARVVVKDVTDEEFVEIADIEIGKCVTDEDLRKKTRDDTSGEDSSNCVLYTGIEEPGGDDRRVEFPGTPFQVEDGNLDWLLGYRVIPKIFLFEMSDASGKSKTLHAPLYYTRDELEMMQEQFELERPR